MQIIVQLWLWHSAPLISRHSQGNITWIFQQILLQQCTGGGPELLFFSAIGNEGALIGNVGFQDIISLTKLDLSQIDRLQWDFAKSVPGILTYRFSLQAQQRQWFKVEALTHKCWNKVLYHMMIHKCWSTWSCSTPGTKPSPLPLGHDVTYCDDKFLL